ncbi:DUF6807 domain-containing protein [Verrucomicrobiota bacterium sgz303538]
MLSPKLILSGLALGLLGTAAFGAVDIKQQDGKVRVEIDGQLFTEYCYTGASHVYYYPLIGPGGAKMTRDWPMANVPNEEHDHPHHRSLWYAHGLVNGVDFWSEDASHGNKPPKIPVGKIVHEKFLETKGGEKEGVISAQLKWVAPDGSVPITSVQTLRVYGRPSNERLFDLEVTLKAGEKDVVFGDTKEGTMAVRIAESMRLKQPKNQPGQGHILTNEGIKDGEAWGKHAAWVDYWGPVEGKTVGIAIFDHPKNLRYPTRWHARDYGLFAANPFCEREMDKTQPEGKGEYKLAAGQSVTFRYRFYMHEGDAAQAKVAERFAEFSK